MRLALLALALVAGCTTASDTRSPDASAGTNTGTPASGTEPVVVLERTVCYGTCPAYTVSAYADGRVVFEGREHVARTGTVESRVEPSVVAALVARATEIGHATLPEHLTGGECEMLATDGPSAITTIRTAAGTSTVARDGGCRGYEGEDVLPSFEDQIDAALGTAAYIGER